jgi:hypothetical protein
LFLVFPLLWVLWFLFYWQGFHHSSSKNKQAQQPVINLTYR